MLFLYYFIKLLCFFFFALNTAKPSIMLAKKREYIFLWEDKSFEANRQLCIGVVKDAQRCQGVGGILVRKFSHFEAPIAWRDDPSVAIQLHKTIAAIKMHGSTHHARDGREDLGFVVSCMSAEVRAVTVLQSSL